MSSIQYIATRIRRKCTITVCVQQAQNTLKCLYSEDIFITCPSASVTSPSDVASALSVDIDG